MTKFIGMLFNGLYEVMTNPKGVMETFSNIGNEAGKLATELSFSFIEALFDAITNFSFPAIWDKMKKGYVKIKKYWAEADFSNINSSVQ